MDYNFILLSFFNHSAESQSFGIWKCGYRNY